MSLNFKKLSENLHLILKRTKYKDTIVGSRLKTAGEFRGKQHF